MSEDDELAREEAYIAKITARKNQAFEKKVFGGGLEGARTAGGSAKFGGGLEAARAGSAGGSGKFGGGLEVARAQAGMTHPGMNTYSTPTPTSSTTTPELRGGLEAARAQAGLTHPGMNTTYSTPTPTPTYSAPAPVHTPTPAPQPVHKPVPFSAPPLQSEVIELTMDLPLPPIAKYVAGDNTNADLP